MSRPDSLEEIADHYRREGYEVAVRPRPEDLPAFFANSDTVLLATKGNEYRAVHASPQTPTTPAPDRWPPVSSGREPEPMHLRALLAEAERCLRTGALEATLLLAWSVLEAALRQAVRAHHQPLRRPPLPRDLLREAGRLNLLTDPEFVTLDQALNLRNMVAHGLEPDILPAEAVLATIQIARRLTAGPPDESGSEGFSGLKSVKYGYGIRQAGELLTLAAQANRVLAEVLGASAGLVSAEWDRTADTRMATVVTLRISDSTGSVTGTFAPDDLRSYPVLRNRLYRLWGDLLQVRNHQLLQELGAGTGREGE